MNRRTPAFPCSLAGVMFASLLSAQTGVITTVAGGVVGDGGAATSAQLHYPNSVAVASDGSVYIADTDNHRIRRIGTDGKIATVAGTGESGYNGDGIAATNALLNFPYALALGGDGSLYIADSSNARIRKVGTDGKISTIAGGGGFGSYGDGGPATSAWLYYPQGVVVGGDGRIYIADTSNHRVRVIGTDGKLTTLAGTGTAGFAGDGDAALSAQLNYPKSITLAADGTIFFSDNGNNRVRRIGTDGKISTVIGNGTAGFAGDGGPSTAAQINYPVGLAIAKDGTLHMADGNNRRIRRLANDGTISTVAGSASVGFSGDGAAATSAWLYNPNGVAFGADGSYYIADTYNHRIRKVGLDGKISTLGGTGTGGFSGDGGAAISAQINQPLGIAVANDGSVYFADASNNRVRRLGTDGKLSTVAGTGTAGSAGDGGPALSAQLNYPESIVFAPDGSYYIAERYGNRVRRVGTDGKISTVAGNGTYGYAVDGGPASLAQMRYPEGVALGKDGSLYIADTYNHRIRKVGPDGNISTVAGSGTQGFSGDGGPATAAQLNYPDSVAVAADGTLYISDDDNHRIRRVGTDGKITTFAGTGTAGYGGDAGLAVNAQLYYPQSIALGSDGSLYVVDDSSRVRRIGTDGKINSVAGVGGAGFSGDGRVASSAQFYFPGGVAVAGDGSIYVSDWGNNRIRKVAATSGAVPAAPVITSVSTVSAQQQFQTITIQGRGFGTLAAYTGDNAFLAVSDTTAQWNAGCLGCSVLLTVQSWTDSQIVMQGFAGGYGVGSWVVNSGDQILFQVFNPQTGGGPGRFTVTAAAAAPSLILISGNNQTANPGSNFAQPLAVRLAASGVAASGVPVQFSVASGSATLSSGTVNTDSNGSAQVLAQAGGPGPVSIMATAGNSSVTFTLTVTAPAFAPGGVVTTVAGGYTGDGGSATDAALNIPRGVAVAVDGSYYVSDYANHRVRRVGTDGTITTVAGTGESGYSGDGGPATNAKLNFPYHIAVGPDGSLFIADAYNHRIRKVGLNGVITTVAGSGVNGFAGDAGPATAARLAYPYGVAVSSDGTIYVADTSNHRVRRVTAAGTISTLAGTGTAGYGGDGSVASGAQLNFPFGVSAAKDGTVLIADTYNHRLRRVGADGNISTIAGNGTLGSGGDGGSAVSAQLNYPYDSAMSADGGVYIADSNNNRIRRIGADGKIATFAGNGNSGFSGDGGAATSAQLSGPNAIALASDGSVYIVDTGVNAIRQVSNAKIRTLAGSPLGGVQGDGGLSVGARLLYPYKVAARADGGFYIADRGNNRIRLVGADGTMSTFAGTGAYGSLGDGGQAMNAQLNYPSSLAVGGDGTLYIADTDNQLIRRVTPDGVISTYAGTGATGSGGDGGPSTKAQLNSPWDLATGPDGSLYIADRLNNKIRRVGSDGNITTVVGTGTAGFSGDGGPATSAQLSGPDGITVAGDGTLYIADYNNQRIRRVATDGTISTIAGTGTAGFTGDQGPAVSAQLSFPQRVAAGVDGSVFIADTSNHRIRRIDPSGKISTLGGTGSLGFSGDGGAATNAQFYFPNSVAVGVDGGVLFTDYTNHRIRRVASASSVAPSISITSGNNQSASVNTGFNQPLIVKVSNSSGALPGVSVQFTVASGSATLSSGSPVSDANGLAQVNVQAGSTAGAVRVTASAGGTSVTFTLTVSSVALPSLTASSSGLAFVAVAGSPAPASQQVTIGSTGAALTFTVQGVTSSGGNWLQATTSKTTTSSVVTVTASTAGLGAGTYNGNVAVTADGAANSPIMIPVVFVVGAPVTTQVTINSTPPGLVVAVDGTNLTTPGVMQLTPGSSHTLDVPTPQGSGSTRYSFDHWSQGGTKAQTITVPGSAATYTAALTAQYFLSTTVSPTAGGAVTASPGSADGFYPNGAQVLLTASAASGYSFSTFSGDVSGSNNPQLITMSGPKNVTATFAANAVNTKVTVSSTPAGRTVLVDGVPVTTPGDFNWAPASTHTLEAQSPQGVGLTRYAFDKWSNGGGSSQTITTPTSATTYSANFLAQHYLTTVVTPSNGGSLAASPASADGFYTQGSQVKLTATASSGFTFANFGDQGSANPLSVTISQPVSVTANFTAAVPLTATPTQLSLNATQGSNATSTVQVDGGVAGQNVPVTVDQAWLRVSPSLGNVQSNVPFVVSVVAASSGLAPGSYTGHVTINGTLTVTVTFQVTAPPSGGHLLSDALATGKLFALFVGSAVPATQDLNITSSDGSKLNFTANVTYPSGTRNWVSVTPRGGQTPATLQVGVQVAALGGPGTYTALLVVSANGSPDVSIPLTLTFANPPKSQIQVDVQDLKMSSVGDVQKTSLVVKNSGPGTLPFTASVQMDDPSVSWLKATPNAAAAVDQQAAVVQVSADPVGLPSGTYGGTVMITDTNNNTSTVRVAFAVTAASAGAKLMRSVSTGLTLRAGGARTGLADELLEMLAFGTSAVSWSAQADKSWIQLTPASGTISPGSTAGSPSVSIDLAQLQAGSNKGLITIHSDSAGGDLSIPVEVQLLPAGVPVNQLKPTGMAFVPPFGPRQVTYVPSDANSKLNINSNQPWLKVEDVSQKPYLRLLQITVDASKLPPGTPQPALIGIQELSNGAFANLAVLAYAPFGGNAGGSKRFAAAAGRGATAACVPSVYTPLATSFFQNFEQNGGAATSTEIVMIDDCGNPVTTGVTGGVLGNGDPQLNLRSLGDGRWKATWNPTTPNSYVTLNIIGADPDNNINPTVPVRAASSVTGSPTGPVLDKLQPIETEAGVRLTAVAPNGRFRIRGQNLLNLDGSAPNVLIGGRRLEIVNATASAIVVVTPADLAVNVEMQLIVQRTDGVTVPEPVIVAPSWPAVAATSALSNEVILTGLGSGPVEGLVVIDGGGKVVHVERVGAGLWRVVADRDLRGAKFRLSPQR